MQEQSDLGAYCLQYTTEENKQNREPSQQTGRKRVNVLFRPIARRIHKFCALKKLLLQCTMNDAEWEVTPNLKAESSSPRTFVMR